MKNTINRKILISLIIIIGMTLSSCYEQKKPIKTEAKDVIETVKIKVSEVAKGTLERYIQLSGEVFATRIVRITPDTAGILTEIMVKPGDRVSVDQVIAMVDPSRPGMSYLQSPVRSKTSGTVTHVPVIAGNQISPQIVIAEIGDLKNLEIECKVPERYLASLRSGLTGRFTSRAYPDDILISKILRISPVVDRRSRTVLITLIPETNEKIRPGQSVSVDLILETRRDVITIPETAITERFNETGVFVIENGKSIWRKIIPGLSQEGIIEVLEGLKTDEIFTIAGVDDLTDGLSVQVME